VTLKHFYLLFILFSRQAYFYSIISIQLFSYIQFVSKQPYIIIIGLSFISTFIHCNFEFLFNLLSKQVKSFILKQIIQIILN